MAFNSSTSDTLPLSHLLSRDFQSENVDPAKGIKRNHKREKPEDIDDGHKELEELYGTPVKRPATEANMMMARKAPSEGGLGATVSSEIVPPPVVNKDEEEEKAASQTQKGTESQPILQMKSPVDNSQLGGKSTNEDEAIIEESQPPFGNIGFRGPSPTK